MYLIDSHCHLYAENFDDDIEEVVQQSINNNVKKILLPNISSQTTDAMLNVCNRFSNCLPMMGLHPCEVNNNTYESELKHVEESLRNNNFIAVGEIGIDLHWNKQTLEIQKEVFLFQIKLAKKYSLPIVIHLRESFDEVIEIIETENDENLFGDFHCFSGDINQANRVINLNGFYLGIGGVVTFKNSNLDTIMKDIDLKHIILETDSPYLSPHPFRGKRNEPKNILTIAEKISIIKSCNILEVSEITTYNCNKLFDLKIET